jgi:hypothetical protein
LLLASVFTAINWLGKETPALYMRQPWQDDPYDVLASLDFVILPLLIVSGVSRVQLCRRYSPLPSRRLLDLLRICGAAIGVCLATELGEWVAVAFGRHRAAWTLATALQVATLATLTVVTVTLLVVLRRASTAVNRSARPDAQPDWLADTVNLGLRFSWILGRRKARGDRTVRWIDRYLVNWVRRRPVAAAALLAAVLALPIVAVKVVAEGYPPALVLLSFALPTAGLFAFFVMVGRYLRVVAPTGGRTPAWLVVALAGCVGGPAVFALHNSLVMQQSAGALNALFFGGGAAAAIIATIALWALRFVRARSILVGRQSK